MLKLITDLCVCLNIVPKNTVSSKVCKITKHFATELGREQLLSSHLQWCEELPEQSLNTAFLAQSNILNMSLYCSKCQPAWKRQRLWLVVYISQLWFVNCGTRFWQSAYFGHISKANYTGRTLNRTIYHSTDISFFFLIF